VVLIIADGKLLRPQHQQAIWIAKHIKAI
jgi:hypothetical protein